MTRSPRVLMTADAVGGVWRYAVDLARELCDGGSEVLLATMGPRPDDAQRREAERVAGLTLVESDYRLEWMDDPWHDVERAGPWLLDLERAWRPDVVHLNGFVHGDLAWSAPVVVAGHSCVMSWWQAVHGRPAPPVWDVYRRRVRSGLAAAGLVVAPTVAMLNALGRHHGPLSRARAVPNGADARRYRSGPKQDFALCVGRVWDEAKNVRALEEAAAGLPWPIRVAGDAEHPSRTPAPQLRGLEPLGRLAHDDVVSLMARASVYVHPARYEPFGLSVLEAALSGCALVLADIASLREIWGDAALFADPDDPSALRAALERVMRDAGVRADLAARARTRAGSLSAARTALGYRRAYDDVRGSTVSA